MKKWKRHISILLIVFFLVLFSFLYLKHSMDTEVSLLSDTVEEQVTKILEMASVKYNYSNVVTYEDNKKISGLNIPFTNKSFIIKYKGYIKSGIDLSNVTVDVKDIKTIKIMVEKPYILDNVIEEEDVYIYSEKNSVFNKLSFNDLYDVLVEEKKTMEEEAIENGLLKDAENNTVDILTTFLQGMNFENIEILFK